MGWKVLFGAVVGVVALAIPGAARAADDVAGSLHAKPAWSVEAAMSSVATTDFGGWGVGVRGGWAPVPIFQFGLAVDTARLHAEGTFSFQPLLGGPTNVSYSQTFQSTLVAAYARLQHPFRYATPYAEVAAGAVVAIYGEDNKNTACAYGSGLGGGLSAGVDGHPMPAVSIGLRAGVRNPGWGGTCTTQGGVWSQHGDWTMTVASLSAGYRW